MVFTALLLTLGFFGGLTFLEKRAPPKLPTSQLIQTGPLKEGLKTDALAELLDLSSDHPKHLCSEEAKRILLAFPCIQKVETEMHGGETLYIDYTLRVPRFVCGDVKNAAVDREGVVFPLSPYYTPKNLPELILGFDQLPHWGDHICEKKLKIASHLYATFGHALERIDLSHLEDTSWGTREIILLFKEGVKTHLLRLPSSHYDECLEKLQHLPPLEGNTMIDLRIPHLAYISRY